MSDHSAKPPVSCLGPCGQDPAEQSPHLLGEDGDENARAGGVGIQLSGRVCAQQARGPEFSPPYLHSQTTKTKPNPTGPGQVSFRQEGHSPLGTDPTELPTHVPRTLAVTADHGGGHRPRPSVGISYVNCGA